MQYLALSMYTHFLCDNLKCFAEKMYIAKTFHAAERDNILLLVTIKWPLANC